MIPSLFTAFENNISMSNAAGNGILMSVIRDSGPGCFYCVDILQTNEIVV